MPKPPTGNQISQGKHGSYSAVDYLPYPDATIYAPEDGRISSYIPNNGTAGNNLKLTGATGMWGMCHLEKPLVSVGQNVVKGQPIGIMGWTGYVEPAGPAGRHLHIVLYRNGQWVYPPDYFNEPFHIPAPSTPTQGAIEMIATHEEAILAYKLLRPNYHPNNDEIGSTAGKRSWVQFARDGQREREQRDAALAGQVQALQAAQHEAQVLRNTITEIQQVEAIEDQDAAAKDARLADLGSQLSNTTNDLQKALLEVERLNAVVCKVPEPSVPDKFTIIEKLLSFFLPKAK